MAQVTICAMPTSARSRNFADAPVDPTDRLRRDPIDPPPRCPADAHVI